ncbi:MAG: ABC transporter ATP-binding protein/permease [Oscillospiraceae bacterium]|nr:ABC transporter ATP-binding protein/permease [Oscillospiraceae bacterium]
MPPPPPPHAFRALDEEIRKNPPKLTRQLLGRIFSYLKPYTVQMLVVTGLIIIAAVLDLLPSILTGRIVDDGLIGGDWELLVRLVLASFAVLLLSNGISVIQSFINAWVAQHITRDMRNQLYAHLQKLSHRFFTSSKQGNVITRMTSDINGVESAITNTVTNTISNVVVLVTSIAVMYYKNWVLATVGLFILPLLVLPFKLVVKKRWRLTRMAQESNDQVNQILDETMSVSGQQLVKLFTREKEEYRRYSAANDRLSTLKIRAEMAGRGMRQAVTAFTAMGPMLIYLIGGYLLLRGGYGNLTVGDITVMVTLLTRMYRPVAMLAEIQTEFVRAFALFGRIFEYLDLPVEIEDKPDAIRPAHIRGELRFDRVEFSYQPEVPVLRQVSFHVPAGQTVAIVGPSGAGKSTLLNLVTRLYDVTDGAVSVAGVDVRDMALESLRGAVGVVTQESFLFNDTIRANLLYAKPDATQEELEAACRRANIHEFIVSLPQGYDSVVGNRGIKLSGGEKQRVSIARAILKDPKILIFDEATSSLDSISEQLIQQAIDPLMQGRTSLIVAHRLSTIVAADEILVMQAGRIVERGTHHELIAAEGVYKHLYETQFRQALEDARLETE